MALFKLFETKESQEKIRQAIVQAESLSAVEIIPMIVRSSIATEHVWPLMSLLLMIPATAVYYNLNMFHLYPLRPWMVMTILVLICVILGQILSRFGKLQTLLTHRRAEQRDVERRALFEFYSLKMDQTIGKTGILLFLSLKERRAVVLADRSISEKVPPDLWQSVVAKLVSVARQDPIQGLTEAILECGKLIAPFYPRQIADKNELPDLLILKD